MNPCPCGYWGDPTRECRCTPLQIQRYVGRISGPLLDRIDIHIDVPAVRFKELTGDAPPGAESSATMRERVIRARERQRERLKGEGIFSNAAMTPRLIRPCAASMPRASGCWNRRWLVWACRSRRMIEYKVQQNYRRLENSDQIFTSHVAEAVGYRPLDRTYWT